MRWSAGVLTTAGGGDAGLAESDAREAVAEV
jgi:hypothetical protein